MNMCKVHCILFYNTGTLKMPSGIALSCVKKIFLLSHTYMCIISLILRKILPMHHPPINMNNCNFLQIINVFGKLGFLIMSRWKFISGKLLGKTYFIIFLLPKLSKNFIFTLCLMVLVSL